MPHLIPITAPEQRTSPLQVSHPSSPSSGRSGSVSPTLTSFDCPSHSNPNLDLFMFSAFSAPRALPIETLEDPSVVSSPRPTQPVDTRGGQSEGVARSNRSAGGSKVRFMSESGLRHPSQCDHVSVRGVRERRSSTPPFPLKVSFNNGHHLLSMKDGKAEVDRLSDLTGRRDVSLNRKSVRWKSPNEYKSSMDANSVISQNSKIDNNGGMLRWCARGIKRYEPLDLSNTQSKVRSYRREESLDYLEETKQLIKSKRAFEKEMGDRLYLKDINGWAYYHPSKYCDSEVSQGTRYDVRSCDGSVCPSLTRKRRRSEDAGKMKERRSSIGTRGRGEGSRERRGSRDRRGSRGSGSVGGWGGRMGVVAQDRQDMSEVIRRSGRVLTPVVALELTTMRSRAGSAGRQEGEDRDRGGSSGQKSQVGQVSQVSEVSQVTSKLL
eukprot:GHVN01036627.1.p1 GENE.GHVN01036627.1~~GHVN01036627.1.p1  ORF type:complete len:493 (-),score=106.70 GHVN01036627.1:417-1724(-)